LAARLDNSRQVDFGFDVAARPRVWAHVGARQNGPKLNSGRPAGIMAGRFSLSASKAEETNT
jgi:hypothetical protein